MFLINIFSKEKDVLIFCHIQILIISCEGIKNSTYEPHKKQFFGDQCNHYYYIEIKCNKYFITCHHEYILNANKNVLYVAQLV